MEPQRLVVGATRGDGVQVCMDVLRVCLSLNE